MAAFVLNQEAQGFPIASTAAGERVSGVENLAYITFAGDRTDEIRRLQEVAPFRRLTYVANEALLAAMPVLEANLRRGVQQVGREATIVRVGTSIDATLAALATASEEVYLTLLPQLSASELDRLVRVLIDRHLPAFSYWGERGRSKPAGEPLRRYRHATGRAAGRAGGAADSRRRGRRQPAGRRPAWAIGVHPYWRVMTEAELLHDEPTNLAWRLGLASAASEAVGPDVGADGHRHHLWPAGSDGPNPRRGPDSLLAVLLGPVRGVR